MKHLEIAGYTILPLHLPPTPSFPTPATHFLYLRPHEPRIPDPDSPRSLFLANIPIDTTETHLRHLFGTQLSAGRVERVSFESVPTKKHTNPALSQGNVTRTKKRKRVTADELQETLDDITLPSTYDRQLQKSGAHAIVVFVDRPSMEASLKAAVKAGRKKGTEKKIVWGEGISEDRVPSLGLSRYLACHERRYPARKDLLRTVNDYMTVFSQVSDARRREKARRVAEPDEDGFVTVSHGPKLNSVAREEEYNEILERQKRKNEGLKDFYRFQAREKRKERENDLVHRFEEDRKRLSELKRRRGRYGYVYIIPC